MLWSCVGACHGAVHVQAARAEPQQEPVVQQPELELAVQQLEPVLACLGARCDPVATAEPERAVQQPEPKPEPSLPALGCRVHGTHVANWRVFTGEYEGRTSR